MLPQLDEAKGTRVASFKSKEVKMGKWVTLLEVFAATFSVVTLGAVAVVMVIMLIIPGIFGGSFLAPLALTYGPGLVVAASTVKKVHG